MHQAFTARRRVDVFSVIINLLGLASVAEEIHQEFSGSREEPIILHFCVSNVPDIDDEEHILERKLRQAKERLKYEGDPQIIHHYNSLSLIEQSVFVIDRPELKLAKEYHRLATQVAASNLGDLRGALARLGKISRRSSRKPGPSYIVSSGPDTL